MKKSSVLTAALGVAIGVLLTLVVQLWSRPAKMRVRDRDWQKINLILKSIDDNYVDSVDHRKVTDVVAEAALQALDPHSIYMVPESLEAHEEDLAGNFDGIGIQFNVPNDTAIVLEVIPGGPSEKVGLKTGFYQYSRSQVPTRQHGPQDERKSREQGKCACETR